MVAAGVLTGLSGCIDDSYDLSDIDDTIKVEVKDLVVPVNLEPVTFSSVVEPDDNENVEIANGVYVITKGGDFRQSVNIGSIEANPTITNAEITSNIPYLVPGSLTIPEGEFKFAFTAAVNENITNIQSIKGDLDLKLTIGLLKGNTSLPISISDLSVQLPKGMFGWYESAGKKETVDGSSASSVITWKGEATANAAGKFEFVFHVTSLDFEAGGVKFRRGEFDYASSVKVVGGNISYNGAGGQSGVLTFGINISHLSVKSYSGEMRYEFDEITHQHIEFNNLPTVLTDKQTRLRLVNPQIYIEFNNPFYTYSRYGEFKGSMGLEVDQQRAAGEETVTAKLTEPLVINNTGDLQKYMLAPEPEIVKPISGYTEATPLKFEGMGDILYGDGLPYGLNFELLDPHVTASKVVDFPVGTGNLGEITGKYTFYAPMAFGAGSQLVYSEDQTGWDIAVDEDLTVTTLSIGAHLKSDLPVGVAVSAIPLDEDGNEILNKDGKPVTVTVEPEMIPAHADTDITITLNGEISGLDGMRYTVRLSAGAQEDALRPDMTVTLTDVRAKVSGYYINKSKD